MNAVVATLCLGIPYLFYNRLSNRRMDVEGALSGPGTMLVIGSCTCLVVSLFPSPICCPYQHQ